MDEKYYPWSTNELPVGNQVEGETGQDEVSAQSHSAMVVAPTRAVSKREASTLTPMTVSQIDVGAQVGVKRNLEFTAGERAHRISTGPYTRS